MVEHRLAKARVASSSLVSRSRNQRMKAEDEESVFSFWFSVLQPLNRGYGWRLQTESWKFFILPPSSFIATFRAA